MIAGRRAGAGRAGQQAMLPQTALALAALAFAVLMATSTISITVAFALTERELELKVQAISDQLRCPTCQGISVKDSEAAFSRQIKDKVRRMVIEGQSDEAIKAFFVSRYGEWILRAPKKEGLGLVLWVLPGLAMVLMGAWIGYRVYAGSKTSAASGDRTAGESINDEQRERIARDLRRFEEDD